MKDGQTAYAVDLHPPDFSKSGGFFLYKNESFAGVLKHRFHESPFAGLYLSRYVQKLLKNVK
ncbi:hypothetical protein FKZ59_10540 [Ureibacillus terrenus]|uniref:Uncharacterized protein n=1 Tax=Ureibacillus terrenus TaxID=118246 RepID=A0A540V0I0_9BACL|nr:hypothetical protein FKZ59_10540 [Ureibacillus terrenus]